MNASVAAEDRGYSTGSFFRTLGMAVHPMTIHRRGCRYYRRMFGFDLAHAVEVVCPRDLQQTTRTLRSYHALERAHDPLQA